MRKKPHGLQWLETVGQRKQLSEKERWDLQRLQKGVLGEKQMDKMAETFLSGKITAIDDITLQYQSSIVQIDKILLIGSIVYIIDMKFYQGDYTLQDGSWQRNGKKLPTNILEQLRRAVRIIENILKEQGIQLQVKGVLAFLDPESNIQIKDDIAETILTFNKIPLWLTKLNQQSSDERYPHWKSILFQYQINDFRTKYKLTHAEAEQLQKGICCPRCHQFQTTPKRHTVHCSCGYVEAKATAYVRTICEYGVIFHDQDLKLKDLKNFFGKNVQETYLKYILKKYFTVIQKSTKRSIGHRNEGILFEYWFENKMDYFNNLEKRKNWKNANF
ncbi:NERD domain-containing protein [Tetragenococcus koreensis]|uniref:nuclease-related domain-containing protein n=1 Tax=Tetragenococcus koreensis TaxID=290335 RepID=UPI000F4E37CA|nr:nuclease-related domain-containing protein [Tetragenococcus koreensis]AYW46445.1 hypothetical protein C7K43_11225 [Tetragenococcus koreensis]MCF1585070.1 NERD domain-containing protein [Tetragenococcus koreensis]MCF1629402.1 NERD domain-containing protein [Tetragenococcus koreensis]MDN6345061.1 NERD domain-containing protein [Tetragenococcus koreensis]MDN6471271.1 NERD domain-containing protein [Tetragenococcus koreensis]